MRAVEESGVEVPYEITDFIASQIRSNIRELEGALIRVIAWCSLFTEPLTLAVAQRVLKDMVREVGSRITVGLIQQRVAGYFQLDVETLRGASRHRSILQPRQLAMFLCRKLTESSLPEIGRMFGGRDHSTVLHAVAKIERELAQDFHKKDTVGRLQQLVLTASRRVGS